MNDKRLTVPNLLTGFRFVAAPFLLVFAWNGRPIAFLVLLALTFLSDVLDGIAARLLNQASAFGARLDSIADMLIYTTIAISAWWLWPEMVRREWFWIAIVVASFILPVAVALAKFRVLSSYHTWTVKGAAALTGLSLYVMVIDGPAWPFHVAALACLVAAVEEIAITAWLHEPQSNVGSIIAVIRRYRARRKARKQAQRGG